MMNEKHKKLALYSVGTVLGSFVAFKVGKWLVKKLTPATPLLFMDYINGARKSGVIKAAIDLNVFTHIYDLERASELATVVKVANKCDASPKGIRILLDALAVSGFIEKHCSSVNPDNWYYTLTPSSKKFLVNSSPDYLGCMTNFILHERMTAPYTNFAENVKRGGQIFEQSNMTVENDVWVEFARSVAPMMQFVAPKVADLIISQRGRNEPMKVLDISTIEDASDAINIVLAVLRNKSGFYLLKEYSIKEMSTENLLLWIEMERLLLDWLTMSDGQRQETLDSMYTRYIQSGSPNEINIPAGLKKRLLALQKNLLEQSPNDQLLVLQGLYNQLLVNIADTFSRFSETQFYEQYIHATLLQKALQDLDMREDKDNVVKFFQYELHAINSGDDTK